MPARVILDAFVPVRVSSVSEPVSPVAGAKASAVDCVIVPVAMMLTAEPELTAATISAALTLVTPALARSPGRVPVVLVVVMVTFVGSISHVPPMPAWTTPGSSRRFPEVSIRPPSARTVPATVVTLFAFVMSDQRTAVPPCPASIIAPAASVVVIAWRTPLEPCQSPPTRMEPPFEERVAPASTAMCSPVS